MRSSPFHTEQPWHVVDFLKPKPIKPLFKSVLSLIMLHVRNVSVDFPFFLHILNHISTQDMLKHPDCVALLSELYDRAQTYPPVTLAQCEVSLPKTMKPLTRGGCGECWRGVFLGHHSVAMKCLIETIPDKAMKVKLLL